VIRTHPHEIRRAAVRDWASFVSFLHTARKLLASMRD